MSPKKNTAVKVKKSDLPIGIRYLETQLKLANEFVFPKFKTWEIDFKKLNATKLNDDPWSSLTIFKELKLNRKQPAIYFFNSTQDFSPAFHTSFRLLKKKSMNGTSKIGSYNICKVPNDFTKTSFLYVGSVGKNLHDRLLCHLGYKNPKTGALFLKQVLSSYNHKEKIFFNYCFIDRKFECIRTLAEYEKQRQFMPLLGSRAFINSEGHFLAYYDNKYPYSE